MKDLEAFFERYINFSSIFFISIYSNLFIVPKNRETKALITSQSKLAVETKEEVNNDATLKTKVVLILLNIFIKSRKYLSRKWLKAEKDRRLKEKNQANTKRFMDERKNTTMKQNKRREKQKKTHETQIQDIVLDVKDVCNIIKSSLSMPSFEIFMFQTILMYTNTEVEYKLADKREAYVWKSSMVQKVACCFNLPNR